MCVYVFMYVCVCTEMGKELSLELSRVVTEMESAMAKHSPLVTQLTHDTHDKDITKVTPTPLNKVLRRRVREV